MWLEQINTTAMHQEEKDTDWASGKGWESPGDESGPPLTPLPFPEAPRPFPAGQAVWRPESLPIAESGKSARIMFAKPVRMWHSMLDPSGRKRS